MPCRLFEDSPIWRITELAPSNSQKMKGSESSPGKQLEQGIDLTASLEHLDQLLPSNESYRVIHACRAAGEGVAQVEQDHRTSSSRSNRCVFMISPCAKMCEKRRGERLATHLALRFPAPEKQKRPVWRTLGLVTSERLVDAKGLLADASDGCTLVISASIES